MTDDPIKIQLDSSTYVTKVNGRLVIVRERRERLRDICLDLLGEVFGKYSRRKMKDGSKIAEGENVPAQNPTATPIQNFPTPLLHNPNANLVLPAPVQSVMGPMGPQPGIYRFGNRQLALLPLNPQGGPAMAPQMGYSHPQPPWMFPRTSSLRDFNFPPNGIDPQQFMINPVPPSEVARQSSVTVTKHICAECGKLRSRKYQHENPLKPGETPSPAFCKKCQKDITSTEESDSSIRNIEKHHKRSKRGRKRRTKFENDKYSSDESLGSSVSQRVSSKPKQNESQNQSLDRDIASEEHRAKHSHRSRRIHLHDIESYIDGHEEATASPEKLHVRQTRSTALPQDFEKYPPVHHSRANFQAQTSSRDSIGMDAAEPFHHTRRELSQTTYERSETDRSSNQVHRKEDSASSEATPCGNYNFKDPIVSISRTRSEEASRGRRLERSINRQGSHRQATGLPYGIHPSEDDEVIVVTERYVIRPRPPPNIQEGSLASRRQSSMDKTTARAEAMYPQFVAEAEASGYHRNDWPRAGEYNETDHDRVRQRGLDGLAALVNPHSSETNSSSSYLAARTDDDYLPRAPSPLSPLHQKTGLRALDTSHHDASYQPSEDESLPSRLKGEYNTARGRISSRYRPPYVREATDKGTERAIMPSPKHSHEKMFYPDANDSEITEEIERAERHVTFQDSDGYEEDYHILNGKFSSGRGLREKGRR